MAWDQSAWVGVSPQPPYSLCFSAYLHPFAGFPGPLGPPGGSALAAGGTAAGAGPGAAGVASGGVAEGVQG